MSDSGQQLELRVVGAESSDPAPPRCSLCVTFDLAAGGLQFEWRGEGTDTVVAGGRVVKHDGVVQPFLDGTRPEDIMAQVQTLSELFVAHQRTAKEVRGTGAHG